MRMSCTGINEYMELIRARFPTIYTIIPSSDSSGGLSGIYNIAGT